MDNSDQDQIKSRPIQAFFDAVTSGDLDQVKGMLAGDAKLLFARLENRGSPAIVAMDAGHYDITDYLAREELRRLEVDTVPRRHLYGAIHDLGEVAHATTGYPMAEQLRVEAEPVVARFLQHRAANLRYITLMVLCLHWHLRSYRNTYTAMMFEDPDEEVRRISAASLGSVLERSHDWEATRHLLRKVRDDGQAPSTRKTAYDALLRIWFGSDCAFRWFLRVMKTGDAFDAEMHDAQSREDWERASLISEQQARVWEGLADWDFIATLERGEEPGDAPPS